MSSPFRKRVTGVWLTTGSISLHYFGQNNADNMATMAGNRQKLKDTMYKNGKQRRWDFERYINVRKHQYSVMEGLIKHGNTGLIHNLKSATCLMALNRTNLMLSRLKSWQTNL
jgi:hypothetical protein